MQSSFVIGQSCPTANHEEKLKMENKTSFFDAFGATIPATEIAGKNGLSYIAAATAMRLAGRPEVRFVDFDGKPYLEMLGGSVVAVDLQVPGMDKTQRMWLPVMDQDNNPLPLKNTKVTDINNSRQRCLVKAIAATHGHGMSLYVNCDGDGAKAVKMLGVIPDSDLEAVTPIIATLKEGGAPFIEWGIGLSACRITDPTFHWGVETYAGLPYREVLGGLMVDVQTVYEGMSQVLSLPVMDSTHNPISADKATPSDWNKAVMRALTKCISFNTGYGIGVYADEFGTDKEPKGGKGSRKATPAAPAAKVEPKAGDVAPATTAPVATQELAETPAAEVVEAAQAEVEAPVQATERAVDAEVVDAAGNTVAAAEVKEVQAEAETTEANVAASAAKSEPAAEAPASAPTEAATRNADAENESVARFRGVLQQRRKVGGIAGVITLFDALKTSTKFDEADKPACFQVLMTSVAATVDNENILDLLGNITKHNAMQYMAADARDLVAARLTSVLLTAACEAGDDALKTAPDDLVSAGVAQDVDDVLRLAVIGHVPAETVDLLRDVLEQAA
jgi:pyruvate/2-oxoglutarate dehydrogenase complex dihydrolipoamide acyltransferase (E2) component